MVLQKQFLALKTGRDRNKKRVVLSAVLLSVGLDKLKDRF